MTAPAIAGILLLLAAPRPAWPQDAAARSKRKALGEIQKQLEAARREIEGYRKLEQSLGGDLQQLESRSEEARKRMDELERSRRAAEVKKQGLKSRLEVLGQASGFWRSELESDLRAYAAALAARSELFGTEDLWAEEFRRAAALEKAGLVSGIAGISRTTRAAEAQTSRRAQDLLEKSRAAQAEQERRRREYEDKQRAIAEARAKKQAAIARAQDLAETAKALTRLLRALGRSRKRGGEAARPAPEVAPNSLAWPADGAVVQPFGRQRNTELDTWVIHQGIVIETKPGAPVVPVEPGRVIFSGPFRSYGQVLILDHGGGFVSVYGELGAPLKQKGAEVAAGEALARAGNGGSGKGRVYLELRQGTEALDPLTWLKKR